MVSAASLGDRSVESRRSRASSCVNIESDALEMPREPTPHVVDMPEISACVVRVACASAQPPQTLEKM